MAGSPNTVRVKELACPCSRTILDGSTLLSEDILYCCYHGFYHGDNDILDITFRCCYYDSMMNIFGGKTLKLLFDQFNHFGPIYNRLTLKLGRASKNI